LGVKVYPKTACLYQKSEKCTSALCGRKFHAFFPQNKVENSRSKTKTKLKFADCDTKQEMDEIEMKFFCESKFAF
jgi:hypothetical protein